MHIYGTKESVRTSLPESRRLLTHVSQQSEEKTQETHKERLLREIARNLELLERLLATNPYREGVRDGNVPARDAVLYAFTTIGQHILPGLPAEQRRPFEERLRALRMKDFAYPREAFSTCEESEPANVDLSKESPSMNGNFPHP